MASLGTLLYVLLFFMVLSGAVRSEENGLRFQAYDELKCPKDPLPLFPGKVDLGWLSFPGTWYIPMGSERVYRLSAEILLGHPATNADELDLIDLRVTSFFGFYRVSGYGSKSFLKGCLPLDRSFLTFPQNLLSSVCFGMWGSEGSNVELAARAVDSVMWTDNKNGVLIMPCNMKSETLDWFLLTKKPTISSEMKKTVVEEIKKFGFNPLNVVYYDYDKKRLLRNQTTNDIV